MGENSPGGREKLKLDLDRIFLPDCVNKELLIIGQPVLAILEDVSMLAQLQQPVNKKFFEVRAASSPLHLVFRDLESFSSFQALHNEGKNSRAERIILSKVQQGPNTNKMADFPILTNRVVFALSLQQFDSTSPQQRQDLENRKPMLLKTMFSSPLLSSLKDGFDEANLVWPSKPVGNKPPAPRDQFYLHIKATSELALKEFNEIGRALKQPAQPEMSMSFGGLSLSVKEVFVPKLNRQVYSAPKATRAFQLRFSRAVVPSNVSCMNSWLAAALGESPVPRVVLGHPLFSPPEPCSFVTLFLADQEAQRGLSEVVSHIHPMDLLEPKSEAILEYDPKSRDQRACIHCGSLQHSHSRCPRAAGTRPALKPNHAPETCRDFSRGMCNRGEECRFSHAGRVRPVRAAPQTPTRPLPSTNSASQPKPSQPIALSTPSTSSTSSGPIQLLRGPLTPSRPATYASAASGIPFYSKPTASRTSATTAHSSTDHAAAPSTPANVGMDMDTPPRPAASSVERSSDSASPTTARVSPPLSFTPDSEPPLPQCCDKAVCLCPPRPTVAAASPPPPPQFSSTASPSIPADTNFSSSFVAAVETLVKTSPHLFTSASSSSSTAPVPPQPLIEKPSSLAAQPPTPPSSSESQVIDSQATEVEVSEPESTESPPFLPSASVAPGVDLNFPLPTLPDTVPSSDPAPTGSAANTGPTPPSFPYPFHFPTPLASLVPLHTHEHDRDVESASLATHSSVPPKPNAKRRGPDLEAAAKRGRSQEAASQSVAPTGQPLSSESAALGDASTPAPEGRREASEMRTAFTARRSSSSSRNRTRTNAPLASRPSPSATQGLC